LGIISEIEVLNANLRNIFLSKNIQVCCKHIIKIFN